MIAVVGTKYARIGGNLIEIGGAIVPKLQTIKFR